MAKDTTNKNFWQKFARIYTAFMAKNDAAYDNICTELEQYIDKEKKVLELACGTGQITFRMADKSADSISTISPVVRITLMATTIAPLYLLKITDFSGNLANPVNNTSLWSRSLFLIHQSPKTLLIPLHRSVVHRFIFMSAT